MDESELPRTNKAKRSNPLPTRVQRREQNISVKMCMQMEEYSPPPPPTFCAHSVGVVDPVRSTLKEKNMLIERM